MTAATVEARLRRLLLGLVMFMSVGTVVELLLAKHTQETDQLIPFVLCGLTFLTAFTVLVRAGKSTIWAFRGVCGLVMLGSLLGMYFHLRGNYEFVTAKMTSTEGFLKAITGAAPLLAPGLMATMALFGLVATYYHPALGKRKIESA